jgi:undecaprenyl-diphosphatase
MAMRIRYLQKGGTDGVVAASAVGLTSLASGVMQVAFVAVFFTWGGTVDGGIGAEADRTDAVSAVVLVVVAIVGVVWAVPKLRRAVFGWLLDSWRKIRDDFGALARRLDRMALLFGGAGLSKLLTIIAFVLSCRAFDIDIGFARLGALYLGANTIASAVPTPGGVGAIEAALVMVLTSAGVDQSVAWSATLLFRLVTYWLPTVPGYVALRYCERADLV